MRDDGAWDLLLPIGIALCVSLSLCVGVICIRTHIKDGDSACSPHVRPPRRMANHPVVRRSKFLIKVNYLKNLGHLV